jgi:membrane associated rhomboid family serine protease
MNWLRTCPLSILLSTATLTVSTFSSYSINGKLFSTIDITKLSILGVVHQNLLDYEYWRLITSQLIHVKYPHMLFNVLFLLILSIELEKKVGTWFLFKLWLFAGGVGTYFSSLFVLAPWNVGTGASQAILAIAISILFLSKRNVTMAKLSKVMASIYIILSLALDLLTAYYPKPGHVLSMFISYMICLMFLRKRSIYARL